MLRSKGILTSDTTDFSVFHTLEIRSNTHKYKIAANAKNEKITGITKIEKESKAMYDLLIKNGTVIDGTGAPRFPADIAVKDGVIAKIAAHIEDEQGR